MQRIVVALLVAVALSGCSDDAPVEKADEQGFLETEQTADTGSITGVVVDTSIVPVSGARVGVVGSGLNKTTDADGRFAFDKLEPGTYFLSVAAPRHLPLQQGVDVKAGKAATVKVVLQPDGLPDPYHQTQAFNGIIHFHATVAWAQLEWMLDSELGITTPACECAFEFTSDVQPQGHVYEAVWEEDTPPPAGGTSAYYWEYAVPDPFQEVYGYATSPVYKTWNGQPWEVETGTYKVLLLGPAEWVAIEQSFEIFLTQWFNTDVPEGWAIADGDS